MPLYIYSNIDIREMVTPKMPFEDESFVRTVRKHLYAVSGNQDTTVEDVMEAIKRTKNDPQYLKSKK